MKIKFIFITTILIFSMQSAPLLGNIAPQTPKFQQEKFNYVPPSTRAAVKAIESVPEAVSVLKQVQEKGAIRIETEYFHDSDFEALWDSTNRIIYINEANNETTEKMISSILFELHNAKTDEQLKRLFKQAKTGQIDKESYVESVEKLEYHNALATSQLIEKGIQEGMFSRKARWEVCSNFQDHYRVQQLHGHSQWIANKFNNMSPAYRHKDYKGTINNLGRLTEKEKRALLREIAIKERN